MSSAKWRPFCLGLNVLTRHLFLEYIQWKDAVALIAVMGGIRFVVSQESSYTFIPGLKE